MSLSLPNSYKRSNIAENWVFQLFNENAYLSFDGVNDYIDLGATNSSSAIAITSSTGISVSFWVNFPETGGNEVIFASNTTATYSGYWIQKATDDTINFNWGDDSGAGQNDRRSMAGSTALSANTWYHIVITSTFANAASGTNIYINNVAESITPSGNASVTTPTYVSDGKAYIGREDFTNTNYGGKLYLRNLAVWGSLLSSNNRTSIYNSGNYRSLFTDFGNYNNASNLKGCWEFNTGENAATDLTSNLPIGNISGAIYKGFLPISYSDTMIDDIFYSGSVVSKNSTIRDTIDLEKSLAKSSNLSFDVADFKYNNKNLSEDVLFGSNYYINKTVKVFSQPNATSSINNCVQIYNGRLTNIDMGQSKVIKFNVTAKRPWDYITIPQDKTPVSSVYVPVVYGDYDPNVSSYNTPSFCDTELYPVPVLVTNEDEVMTLMPRSYSSGSNSHINMHQGGDVFLPFASSGGNVTDATGTIEDNSVLRTILTRVQSGYVRGRESTDEGGTGTDFSNMHLAFDSKSNTFSTAVINDGNNYLFGFTTGAKEMFFSHQATQVKITHKFSGSATFNIFLLDSPYTGTPITTTRTFAANTTYTETISILNNLGSKQVSVPFKFLYIRLSGGNGTMSISDVQVKLFSQVFAGDDDEDKDDMRELSRIEHYYSGGDGLTAFNSWKTADSGLIKFGHEAHRDLLERFTNFNYKESDIYNWSAVDTLRDGWSIRWWALEPEELQKVLENIQEEFSFIFKWRADGTPSYWAIKNSYASSDVAATFTIDDISSINITHTDFSSLITKMDIKYKMNPANKNMLLSQTSEDTTTSPRPRQKWNIKDKENIKEVNLKYNYAKVGSVDSGSGNANDGYANYYMNIFGDIKKIISCSIVNPSKAYKLEAGDIVKFNIDEIKPFGGDWNGYYMITDFQRSIGKVNIKCREVG